MVAFPPAPISPAYFLGGYAAGRFSGPIAPAPGAKWGGCKAALVPGGQPTVPVREDARYWLQVRAQFKCKQCDRRSPVNHVDVDGTFTCLRCQVDQRADAGIWATGLRFCHEVGDLEIGRAHV